MTALSYVTDGYPAPLTNHHNCPQAKKVLLLLPSSALKKEKKKNSSNTESQSFLG